MSNIEHPKHYNATKYEVWDVLDAWFPTNPTLWNVGKYLARADRKGGVEDLKKAKVYLEREIERREAVSTSSPNLGHPPKCPKCETQGMAWNGFLWHCMKCSHRILSHEA